ncbi:MAG: hypothetical protein SH848_05130 [Saprospiraceae bacterium]|nr:hypothetical protein [Saprospiraceae bacterium]MDZ4703288.1 hypothetical protein [Saprospiraceae bacterium]
MKNWYNKYLLPGFIFQSIIIGGGYGTGREMVEFFMTKGPLGGYLGMLISMLIWSLVMALGFEFARKEQLYDYRSFLKSLLGKGWILFEIIFIATMMLVIAVLGSATGELCQSWGIPKLVGIAVMFAAVGYLVFKGSKLIEKVFSIWSFVLYGAYFLVILVAFSKFGNQIAAQMGLDQDGDSWLKGGFQYAAYNLGALPAILFVARHFETRKEAVIAGLVSGPLGMIPAILIYTAMLASYPAVLSESVPAFFLIEQFNMPLLLWFFQIVLFGTFIKSGTGLIHGFNERIAGVYKEKGQKMPDLARLGVGIAVLLTAVFIANAFGLIDLIARGYGYITWAFWIIFLLPLLIRGSLKIFKKERPDESYTN